MLFRSYSSSFIQYFYMTVVTLGDFCLCPSTYTLGSTELESVSENESESVRMS